MNGKPIDAQFTVPWEKAEPSMKNVQTIVKVNFFIMIQFLIVTQNHIELTAKAYGARLFRALGFGN